MLHSYDGGEPDDQAQEKDNQAPRLTQTEIEQRVEQEASILDEFISQQGLNAVRRPQDAS